METSQKIIIFCEKLILKSGTMCSCSLLDTNCGAVDTKMKGKKSNIDICGGWLVDDGGDRSFATWSTRLEIWERLSDISHDGSQMVKLVTESVCRERERVYNLC